MNGRGTPGSGNVAYLPEARGPGLEAIDELVVYPSSFEGTSAKPYDWLVDGAILKHTVTLFAGDSDLGKSYLAQQLAVAAAIGEKWIGRNTTKCRSFALFSEDGEIPLRHRQDAIMRHYGLSHADLELEVAWLDADRCRNPALVEFERFGRTGKPTPLWHQLRRFIMEGGFQLIIIDTAASTFRGMENDRGQVTFYVQEMLTRLAIEIDGAVLLTLHPPKDGASWYSGSGAWKASARSAISIERPKGYNEETGERADERVVRARKGNYSGPRPWIPMHWQDGVFVADEVPERKRQLSQPERQDLDYRMLAALKRYVGNGTAIPADPEVLNSLPRRAKRTTAEFRDWPLVWLADAVERLIRDGRIVKIEIRGNCIIRPAEMKLPNERPWEAI